jgi:hypothetical protein
MGNTEGQTRGSEEGQEVKGLFVEWLDGIGVEQKHRERLQLSPWWGGFSPALLTMSLPFPAFCAWGK